MTIGRSGVTLDGPILEDHRARLLHQERTLTIVSAVDQLPRTAIIVAGWELPGIETQLLSTGRNLNQFVYLIPDKNSCVEYQMEGRSIFFLPGMDDYNKRVFGVDLTQFHAQQWDPFDVE